MSTETNTPLQSRCGVQINHKPNNYRVTFIFEKSMKRQHHIRKAKRKAFLVPGYGMWTLEYLATQKVTHTVLTSNMDGSSFARHHT